MPRGRTNPDFLNGVPELVILQLLAGRPMYGYELVQAIRRSTGEVLSFGEGSVYPILHRLEGAGCIAGRREMVGGRSRVVYRLTKPGGRRLATSARQWRKVAEAIRHILQGGNDEPVFA